MKKIICAYTLVLAYHACVFSDEEAPVLPDFIKVKSQNPVSVSSNPGTVDILTGTGDLGKWIFQLKETDPLRFGAVWLADGDVTLTKNKLASRFSGNNLLILGMDFDTGKCSAWKGGLFGVEFLQFNGMNSNGRVGSVQGFDSMPANPPYARTELYQAWYRQELFDKKLCLRIGKTLPSLDFNNVLRPIPVQRKSEAIPAVSGLLFTPVFTNPVNIGVMPGYYDSAYGVTANIAPIDDFYVSLGAYDGNLARGKNTGLEGPHFNGYYFYAAETGVNWFAGRDHMPGIIALGGWYQTGLLSIPDVTKQNGAQGVYLFGSQRVWFRSPGVDDSGISVFWQAGLNNGKTLPMNRFVGFGLTAFGLTRPSDSFGMGLAWSKLNKRLFERKSELMLQTYYQAHLFLNTFIEPVLSYIPFPGGGKDLPQTCIFSVQVINLF